MAINKRNALVPGIAAANGTYLFIDFMTAPRYAIGDQPP